MSTNDIERKSFCTSDDVTRFRGAWKAISVSRQFTARDMAAYFLITGKPLKPAFSLVSNAVKLAAGQHPRAAWINALTSAGFGFDTRRTTEQKPSPREFKTMSEWFNAVAAMPKTQNRNLLKLFSPGTEAVLADVLGPIFVLDLDAYRECFRAELLIARG